MPYDYVDSAMQKLHSLLISGVAAYEKAPQHQQRAVLDERAVSVHRKYRRTTTSGTELRETCRCRSGEGRFKIIPASYFSNPPISFQKVRSFLLAWLVYRPPIASITTSRHETQKSETKNMWSLYFLAKVPSARHYAWHCMHIKGLQAILHHAIIP